VRGFGPHGQWSWGLPRGNEQRQTARLRPIPCDWVEGVDCLTPDRPPNDVPRLRLLPCCLISRSDPKQCACPDWAPQKGMIAAYSRTPFSVTYPPHQPPAPYRSATPQQASDDKDLQEDRSATQDIPVADRNEPNPLKSRGCCGVADRAPPPGEEACRTCAQCRGPVDGKERQVAIGDKTVSLHSECERFYLEAEALPW
jgi:hypothetical protein